MNFLDIIPTLNWRDFVDILFLSLVTYQLFVWFRGTKALRVLIGLVVLGGIYSLARIWGLFMTTWAFQVLWQVLVILLLILFQSEIRQVLEKVSPLRYLRSRKYFSKASMVDELVQAVFELARERVGAIMVLVREDNPAEFIHSGQPVMGLPGSALIRSIFNPQAPSHDGAVIISDSKLVEMGAFLPLSGRDDLPNHYGTRHRAAVGLSEQTDAICLVASEERGEVSTVISGEIKAWESPDQLTEQLKEWLGMTGIAQPTIKGFLKSAFVENWGAKAGALAIITLAWLVLAGQQNFGVTVTRPVNYLNIPPGLVLSEETDRQVSLKLTGPRHQAVTLEEGEVRVQVSIGSLPFGSHLIRLTSGDIVLPLGMKIDSVGLQNLRVVLIPETSDNGLVEDKIGTGNQSTL